MTSARKSSRGPKQKPSNLLYILPLIILAFIAAGVYAWRQSENAQVRANTLAFQQTTEANRVATAEAIALLPTATRRPTRTPLPTATSVPTEIPTSEPPATATPLAAVEPTEAPAPTEEPTAEPTATLLPTATPLPSPTPSPTPVTIEVVVRVNQSTVRRGPSRGYSSLGLAVADQSFAATGRSEAGDWVQICCFNEAAGWISAELLTSTEGVSDLPIAAPPETQARSGSEALTLYADPSYANPLEGSIAPNTQLELIGRLPNNIWFRVCCTDNGSAGWLFSGTVEVDGDIETVDILDP